MRPKQVPVYHIIDGLKYSTGYTAENVRQALSYMPRGGDIVMVSYVKVGNNWLEQIIQLILHRGESAMGTADYHMRTPYPEMIGTTYLERMPPPRFMKTHFDYSRQPINPKARYLYLARNPLDVCVSFFHFTRSIEAYKFQEGSFDDFFDLFVTGETDWGDYLDHLASWYEHRHDDNVLFLTYEQLKRDFRATVLRVARFLGSEYEDMLLNDPGVYEKLVQKSSIPFMRKLLEVNEEIKSEMAVTENGAVNDAMSRLLCDDNGKVRKVTLVRKGVIGDWKSLFTADHLRRMRERIAEKDATPIIADLWRTEDLGGVV
uniref:Putative sulfotransferase ixodes scapularis sulfotransferase n=1 Tax=Amblyomma triste TaxID=251400 RepID=A0A023GI98_AMBTT